MSPAKEVKADRMYTKDHEWALTRNGETRLGVTAFAVEQLGDITLVSLDVQLGSHIEAGKPFGTIESVKTLSDLFAPVSGKVTSINQALEDQPELINEDCWERGWMVAVEATDLEADESRLLDAAAYGAHLEASDH